jgi:hypothetical protein
LLARVSDQWGLAQTAMWLSGQLVGRAQLLLNHCNGCDEQGEQGS